jgi:N-acyl homoserine lactone hydrolase
VIRAHLAAELLADGERLPVFVWTIDHPAGLVLVDTGMIDSRPEIDDMSPTPHPENIPRDVAWVINTHLHFDHCGGNRLFPGVPIHVQARELADARSLDDYTIRGWVDFDGATYVEHEGEVELLSGIRLLPAPGHTDGHQVVVVETGAGTNVLGGDVGVWFGELGSGTTEGQRRVLALGAPTWLSHAPGRRSRNIARRRRTAASPPAPGVHLDRGAEPASIAPAITAAWVLAHSIAYSTTTPPGPWQAHELLQDVFAQSERWIDPVRSRSVKTMFPGSARQDVAAGRGEAWLRSAS